MVLIYTTCKNAEDAKKMGKDIIEKRLASCVNVWPIGSTYYWEDKLTEDTEAALLIKTNEHKIAQIEELLLKNHVYATPFIGSIDVRRLNREYKEWMSKVIA